MPEDAPPNGGASEEDSPVGAFGRVLEMQAKLHRWAVADPGRRFDDLFNFVHDPATLIVAFDRVAGNQGARTAGVDGMTVADVERDIGTPGFLDGLRSDVKSGAFRPLPVRERKIPKPGGAGKVRSLGIPSVADRTVQAALKLVLEPIFEADFLPVSYGFRPKRRAQDAIAEIQRFGSKGYHWVLDADIEAAFDNVSHCAVMDAVRKRVKDKRVLALVKAFLKSGILSEDSQRRGTHTGTPQGGILSPLIFNVALSALDEHLHRDWLPGGRMDGQYPRRKRRRHGLPNWRIVRYADDFAIMVHGSAEDAAALQDEVASVLELLGLRLSPAKTRIVHIEDGVDFLGFRIRRRRKRGSNKWYVYAFIAARPIRSVKDKIRALTRRTSQADPRDVLIRLNQIMRGWANYFRHAVAKHTFRMLGAFLWHRVIMWLKTMHRWSWKDVRSRLLGPHGSWLPITADGVELINLARTPAITRYRYRGDTIPSPWPTA